MIDPYDLAANKVAARLEIFSKELCTNEMINTWCEIVSKELCTNETINTWCEIVSKTVSEQRDEGQSLEKE